MAPADLTPDRRVETSRLRLLTGQLERGVDAIEARLDFIAEHWRTPPPFWQQTLTPPVARHSAPCPRTPSSPSS